MVARDPAATLEPHEIRKLLQLPDRRTRKGKRAAALLAVLSYGLRIGEAVTLRRSQVKTRPGDGLVRLRDVRILKRRDGAKRQVILDATASQLVRDWMTASGSRLYLFPGRRDHLSVDAAQDVVDRYLRTLRPECSAHNLRHSFITNIGEELIEAAGSGLVGHKDIAAGIRAYSHLSPARREKAAEEGALLAAHLMATARARRTPRRAAK